MNLIKICLALPLRLKFEKEKLFIFLLSVENAGRRDIDTLELKNSTAKIDSSAPEELL